MVDRCPSTFPCFTSNYDVVVVPVAIVSDEAAVAVAIAVVIIFDSAVVIEFDIPFVVIIVDDILSSKLVFNLV